MNKGRRETIMIRIVSASFVVLALAVFKPFGLDAWQWQAYVHLLAMWMSGILSCVVTEGVLKYVVKKPRSVEQGVSYIIRRNLWFQIINTPLVALSICLYRHFVMSDLVESNHLSWSNFFETLVIIAFCSFAIGLYWRFKFRSRYLAAELEETRMLNEQLQKLQMQSLSTKKKSEETEREGMESEGMGSEETGSEGMGSEEGATKSASSLPHTKKADSGMLTLTGTTSDTVTLETSNLLYVEAVGNYVKVYQLQNGQVRTDMLRATSKQVEDELRAFPMIVRCHRAFLVNLGQVEQIVSHAGSMQLLIKHSHESIPVSRSNMTQVKEAIKGV